MNIECAGPNALIDGKGAIAVFGRGRFRRCVRVGKRGGVRRY